MDFELAQHYFHLQRLEGLGSYYAIDRWLNPYTVRQELESFAHEWKLYNPNKSDMKREGLAVTSLDGGLSGVPDLTSLKEHNRNFGTDYSEMSFRARTPVAEIPSLKPILAPFEGSLGRSHFLRLGQGGYFPYHRDLPRPGTVPVFRLFFPLHASSDRDFVFLLGRDRLALENGRGYFINTRMEHALFSFEPDALCLVLNIEANEQSVNVVYQTLQSY